MDLVSIVLIIVGVWFGVLVVVLAISKASSVADADEKRFLAPGTDDALDQRIEPTADPTLSGERRPIDRAELEREADRLHVDLPERWRLRRRRLAGIYRHRK
jgi:hypothetical protein